MGSVDLSKLDNRAALRAIISEQSRRRWAQDPVLWVNEKLGEHVWSKQADIMRSVRDHRLTAVQSCNGAGKSKIAALIVCWFLDIHPPGTAFVVTSAMTWKQVRSILWREISRSFAKGKLRGRLNQTEWYMSFPDGHEEVVAFGHKPADNDPGAFKGIHAPKVLVVFDEAQGLDKMLYGSAGTLLTSAGSRWLAIGNPDDPTVEFAVICAENSGWNVIKISAYETPNFTGEQMPQDVLDSLVSPISVASVIQRWGKDHPFYFSQVLGEFPQMSEDTLIPLRWIRDACNNPLDVGVPSDLGVDVGGGVDKSVICVRQGPVAHIESFKSTPDTSVVYDDFLRIKKFFASTAVKIDATGIGKGAADLALADGHTEVIPLIFGGTATDYEHFGNMRAEGYWNLRELFRQKKIYLAPNAHTEDLVAELMSLRYKTNAGRIYCESKDDMKRRGLHSPDRADALMMAFAVPPAPEKKPTRATWGRSDGTHDGTHSAKSSRRQPARHRDQRPPIRRWS